VSKRHLLIDYDSTIPNLALMKISSWAKRKGDLVFLNRMEDDPDYIWLSCLFTWNAERALTKLNFLALEYPDAIISYGGTGFDAGKPYADPTRKYLPDEIERMLPDYDLYHDDRAIGFCQRGCNRKCPFCDVWRKEGRIDQNEYHRLTEWVPADKKKILLLDNDVALFDRNIHDQILQDARQMGAKLSITQGYDIRMVAAEPDRALDLAENKPYDTNFKRRTLYIAWDMLHIEKDVRKGIEALLDAGFKGYEIKCYIIVGSPDRWFPEPYKYYPERDLHRAEVLWKEYGVYPWVMPYNNVKTDQKIIDFERWINKYLFKVMDFQDYDRSMRKNKRGWKATYSNISVYESEE
jgi:hypothetical protein